MKRREKVIASYRRVDDRRDDDFVAYSSDFTDYYED